MLKMNLGADIDNIPYLLYMSEQEERESQERAETADLIEPCYLSSCDDKNSSKNGFGL